MPPMRGSIGKSDEKVAFLTFLTYSFAKNRLILTYSFEKNRLNEALEYELIF